MMTTSPFGNTSNPSGERFPSPTNSSRAPSYVWPVVLLVLMGVIGVLLFEGLLGFPGLFFWLIGGDLMQFWFLSPHHSSDFLPLLILDEETHQYSLARDSLA